MIDAAARNALLHGTTEAPPEMRLLRAGPVAMLLDGVDLRYMRIGRTELVRRIFSATGRAYLVGVTGPPGAGKSTLVDRLIAVTE